MDENNIFEKASKFVIDRIGTENGHSSMDSDNLAEEFLAEGKISKALTQYSISIWISNNMEHSLNEDAAYGQFKIYYKYKKDLTNAILVIRQAFKQQPSDYSRKKEIIQASKEYVDNTISGKRPIKGIEFLKFAYQNARWIYDDIPTQTKDNLAKAKGINGFEEIRRQLF